MTYSLTSNKLLNVLYLLMYKMVSSGICCYIANHLKIGGLKIVYFISCFCRLTGHNWQFSLGSLESCRQMLAWLHSAECPGCFTPMAGSRCWLWAGSSVRVINCGHSMWLGVLKAWTLGSQREHLKHRVPRRPRWKKRGFIQTNCGSIHTSFHHYITNQAGHSRPGYWQSGGVTSSS